MLRRQLLRVQRMTWRFAPLWMLRHKRASAKALWSTKNCGCDYARIVHDAATPGAWNRVLEFGANWGGNLEYVLQQHPNAQVVGIDVNPVVLNLAAKYPRYQGIAGDETALEALDAGGFDLAFTVSVLDHIPSPAVVEGVIKQLIRAARQVILLEPFVDGVDGDVSGRTRNEVRPGLERGDKRFAPHSYLWNYDAMLRRMGARWEKRAMPLHAHSLGPFYYLYVIEGNQLIPAERSASRSDPQRSTG